MYKLLAFKDLRLNDTVHPAFPVVETDQERTNVKTVKIITKITI
jgi:hypothetical protein